MKPFLLLSVLLLTACSTLSPPVSDRAIPADYLRLNALLTGSDTTDDFNEMRQAYREDPDFSCRHPVYFRYFSETLPDEASASQPCTQPVPFYVTTLREGMKTVWIDPARVHAIHLVFAGKGNALMSRFGHVSLRLVVCPESNPTPERCDANLKEHLVLGFMANVNDLELDTLKALQGGYQAYLFANRFMDVYQGYAIAEFREIYSLPLEMDDAKRSQMVRELSEIHWRFTDKYHFFSNNCTGLLQHAMQVLLPDMASQEKFRGLYIRPDHFFEAMQDSPLTAGEKTASLELAEQHGFYFSSTLPFYEQALKTIQPWMGAIFPQDLSDYMNTKPEKRLQIMQADHAYWQQLASDEYLRDAQLMLEELALVQSERKLMHELLEYLREDFPDDRAVIRQQLDDEQGELFETCFAGLMTRLAQPIRREKQVPDRALLPDDFMVDPICLQSSKSQQIALIFSGIDSDSKRWQRTRMLADYWGKTLNNILLVNDQALGKRSAP